MSYQNDFIDKIAPIIQKYAPQYDIAVCSPIIAQAVLESQSGTSELAKVHNYFGLKFRAGRCSSAKSEPYYKIGSEQNKDGSYTSSSMQWFQFDTIEKGVIGYFQFTNIPNYSNLKGVVEPKKYLANIKADGYATSQKYVENLLAVIDRYDLTRFDTLPKKESVKELKINKSYPARSTSYGLTRKASQIKYIVLHYTGNQTDKAVNNAKYFSASGSNTRAAGAHYFVDENEIYQSVDDLKSAYSVGGSKYANCSSTGGGSVYGTITNANSISIEMCSSGGVISDKTVNNAVELTKMLMKKYGIPATNVYRHFDVTGKNCPGWTGWADKTAAKWKAFKSMLGVEVNTEVKTEVESTTNWKTANDCPFIIQCLDNMNIRQTPNGTISRINGCSKGIKYTIVDVSGNWGRLKSGAGWICISDKYAKRC